MDNQFKINTDMLADLLNLHVAKLDDMDDARQIAAELDQTTETITGYDMFRTIMIHKNLTDAMDWYGIDDEEEFHESYFGFTLPSGRFCVID